MKAMTWMVAAVLAGCAATGAADVQITDLTLEEIPAEVRALAHGAAEGFRISEVQKKIRDGRTYYDVEGELPDGSELEFDILMTPAGPEIVETQRDIAWADAPESVRAAAPGVAPARVIESTQTDGMVIYELFARGRPADPAIEIALRPDGTVDLLKERWLH
jgi:hypothetical protein